MQGCYFLVDLLDQRVIYSIVASLQHFSALIN